MLVPNRHGSSNSYRYGFNGMEKDDELKGIGNSYNTEFRQYDPRVGRWLSLDPLEHKFPWMSPYVSFNNNPLSYIDSDGLEASDPPSQANVVQSNAIATKAIDKVKSFTIFIYGGPTKSLFLNKNSMLVRYFLIFHNISRFGVMHKTLGHQE